LDFQKTSSLRTRGDLAYFSLVTDVFRDSLEIISAWQWCQRDEDLITAAKMVNSFLKNIFFGASA
jgi:hypothetical protein